VYATHSGCYVVQAEGEGGCMAYDQVCLTVENDFTVYIPNTFTPNGDGLNDFFLVSGEGFSQAILAVYVRWGASMFYSEEVTKGWDGKCKGTECKQDVYTYVLSFYGLDRKFYQRTGNVQLIR
jgi:gliding motility-associated-like protein